MKNVQSIRRSESPCGVNTRARSRRTDYYQPTPSRAFVLPSLSLSATPPRRRSCRTQKVFTEHVQTLAKRGKKQVVPEGLYDALIAVVDLLQKMVRHKGKT